MNNLISTESEIDISDTTEDICSICCGPFHDKTNITYTNSNFPISVCDHEFCQTCLVSWLRINQSCPLCRKSTILIDRQNN